MAGAQDRKGHDMNPEPFIIAAYAVTLGGVFGYLGLSLRRMRNAERLQGDDR